MKLRNKVKKIFRKQLMLTIVAISYALGSSAQLSADFSANKITGCAPFIVKITNLSSPGANKWEWTSSAGISSDKKNPTLIFPDAGIFSVTLKMSNGTDSAITTKEKFIRVAPGLVADFSATEEAGCSPLTTTINDLSIPQSSSIVSWFWSFDNGFISTEQNPTVTFTEANKYNIFLKITDQNGCEASATKEKYINVGKPIASFVFDSVACSLPASIMYLNTSQGDDLRYQWDFGNGSTSTDEIPKAIPYLQYDTVPVKLVVTENITGCKDSVTKEMSIQNYEPKYDIKINCNQDDFSITVQDKTIPTPKNVHWDFGDGTESIESSATHSYESNAERTIVFKTTLTSSCSNTKTLTYKPPKASFNFERPDNCNKPYVVKFNNYSTGNDLKFEWDFGDDSLSVDSSPIHTYEIPPVIYNPYLKVTDKFECESGRILELKIPVPVANFIGNKSRLKGCAPFTAALKDSSIFSGGEVNEYKWIFGDPSSGSLNSDSEAEVSHTYQTPGNYDVTLIVLLNNGCSDTITKKEFIKVGTLPESADFNINFSDTICHSQSLNFEGFTSYSNPTYFDDYFCWAFEKGSSPLLFDPNFSYPECPEGPSAYSPLDKYVNTQNPTHVYGNFEYGADNFLNAVTYTGDPVPVNKDQHVHMISGFNGCYHETIKKIYVREPFAMVGFGFPDGYSNLVECDSSRTIGIFNASSNYDSLVYFHIVDTSTLDTIHVLPENDTTFIKFDKAGGYSIEIAVYDSATKCTNKTKKLFQVVLPNISFKIPTSACHNEEILIVDTTKYGAKSLYRRAWFLNNEIIDEADNPPIDNDTLRTFPVDTGWNKFKLSVLFGVKDHLTTNSDDVSCFYGKTDSIYVEGTKGKLNIDNDIYCGRDSVTITKAISSTSDIKKYYWRLNGEDTSVIGKADSLKVAYETPGDYSFTLETVNEFGCLDTITTDTILISLPQLSFETRDTVACIGDIITFESNSKGNPATYTWSFDNKQFFNRNATHKFEKSGSYDIKLHALDIHNCSDSLTLPTYIRVAEKPETEFKALEILAVCPPYSIQLVDTAKKEGNTWAWAIDGQTYSTAQNYLHTFLKAGKYDVSFTVTSIDGCSETLQKDDYIHIKGPAVETKISHTKLCSPDTATFIMEFTDTKYFVWNFDDGIIESKEVTTDKDTVKHQYNIGKELQPILTIIDDNECSIELNNLQGILADSIGAKFSINDTDRISCRIDSVVFENTSDRFFPVSQEWNFGDGNTGSDSIEFHTYSNDGNYPAKLKIESTIGCVDSVTKNITTYRAPKEQLNVHTPYFCVPIETKYKLTYKDPAFRPDDVYFQFSGVKQQGDSAKINYKTPGDYTVNYIIKYGGNNCIIDSPYVESYYDLPQANFTYDPHNLSVEIPEIYFSNNSVNATSYTWKFGDGSSTNSENAVHHYSSANLFSAQLIASNEGGCSDTLTEKIAVAPHDLVRLPNAFSPDGDGYNDEFGILFAGDMTILSFEIYNRWGNLVFRTTDITKKWDGKFNGKPQNFGTYVYYVRGRILDGEVEQFKGNFSLIR